MVLKMGCRDNVGMVMILKKIFHSRFEPWHQRDGKRGYSFHADGDRVLFLVI